MRKEHDFLGELEIPDNAYYGVQTMRAMENFQITGYTADPLFIKALGMVKKAAALANMKIGLLDEKIGNAMVQACDDIISGKLNDQFPTDPIQGGAGTSFNMNTNEVICNRACQPSAREQQREHGVLELQHAGGTAQRCILRLRGADPDFRHPITSQESVCTFSAI